MNDKERIRGFQIFNDLNLEDLESVLQFSRQRAYKAGDIILEEADTTSETDLFLVIRGMVKVELAIQLDESQKSRKRLAVLKDGEVFGEVGLLRGKGRSARVAAYSDVTVLRIDQRKLFGHFEANPHLGYIIMRNLAIILSERLMDANFMWRDAI